MQISWLIWICTVYKGLVYPGSAGLELSGKKMCVEQWNHLNHDKWKYTEGNKFNNILRAAYISDLLT